MLNSVHHRLRSGKFSKSICTISGFAALQLLAVCATKACVVRQLKEVLPKIAWVASMHDYIHMPMSYWL